MPGGVRFVAPWSNHLAYRDIVLLLASTQQQQTTQRCQQELLNQSVRHSRHCLVLCFYFVAIVKVSRIIQMGKLDAIMSVEIEKRRLGSHGNVCYLAAILTHGSAINECDGSNEGPKVT